MGLQQKLSISVFYSLCLAALIFLPSIGQGGGEYSGGGILYPTSHQFRTAGDARITFNNLKDESGTQAYWSDSFAKVVPEVKLHPESKDRFVADREVCIDGDVVRTIVPGEHSGEYEDYPLEWEELDCVRWRVDRKDTRLAKTFFSYDSAERFANDRESDAVGDPYCRDSDWQMVKKQTVRSYRVKFLADVRGQDELVNVGIIHYRMFDCDQMDRIAEFRQLAYPDFVHNNSSDPEDWVQMAGGEFSGGGKPKRQN